MQALVEYRTEMQVVNCRLVEAQKLNGQDNVDLSACPFSDLMNKGEVKNVPR